MSSGPKPTGLAAIQAITIQDRFYDEARRHVDFIKRYIFPGSCIPSFQALHNAMVVYAAFGGSTNLLLHLPAVAHAADGRYIGEDAIVLNNPTGQVGVRILLGPAGLWSFNLHF